MQNWLASYRHYVEGNYAFNSISVETKITVKANSEGEAAIKAQKIVENMFKDFARSLTFESCVKY